MQRSPDAFDDFPIRLGGLDHVVIRCSRFKQTMAFYEEVLGCRLERSLQELGLYQLRAGTALIDLVPVGSQLGGSTAPQPDNPNIAHFCLQLTDPNWPMIRTHLEKHGIAWTEPQRRYGADGFGLSVYVEDPEGNVVELKESSKPLTSFRPQTQ